MTPCGNGCCCEDGYEYKDGACVGMGSSEVNQNPNKPWGGFPGFLTVAYDFAPKCCWNKNSAVFIGDMRTGHTVRSVDGCTSWTCENGVMQETKNLIPIDLGMFIDNLCATPERERDCEEGYTKRKGHPYAIEEHEDSPIYYNDHTTRGICADMCTSDSDCIAYTANGFCMLMHSGQIFAHLRHEQGLGINYCVKDPERRKM